MGNPANKAYGKWTHAELGEDVNASDGDFTIWKNKPSFEVHYDWQRQGIRWSYTAQGQSIANEEKLDDASAFVIRYSLGTNGNLYQMNFNADGNQLVSGTFDVNLLYPFSATVGTLSTPSRTRPTAKRNDASFSYYHKGWEYPWGIGDYENFGIDISGKVYDNYFAGSISSWSLDRKNNTFTVNMNTSGLPNLIRKEKTTEDLASSDRISFNSNNQYIFSTAANSGWSMESYLPTPSGGNDDQFTSTISGIVFYNDEIYILPSQLASVTGASRNNNVLSWNAVTGAGNYKIYCDDTLVSTQTGTSYTIPDNLYYDQKHTYKIEVCDYIIDNYASQSLSGYWNSNQTGAYTAARCTYFTIRKGVDAVSPDSWKDVGYISHPTVTRQQLAPNKYQYVLSGEYNAEAVDFYYSEGKSGTKNIITDRQVIFDKLKVGVKKDYYFWTKVTNGGKSWFSDGYSSPVTPAKLAAPSITGATKTGINSYRISFSTVSYATSYKVYLNGVIFNGNASSPINVTGWAAASTNKIKVEAVYRSDTTYNNNVEKSYDSSYTPLLVTPTLSKKDIKENNIEQDFGDAGSREILNNVVTQVELSWTAPTYASGYVLYDDYRIWNPDLGTGGDWESGRRYYPTQDADAATEYMNTNVYKLYMDNVRGYHDYSIRAIASADEAYNSGVSNVIHIEQNFPLPKPTITHTANSTEFSILQPVADPANGISQEAIDNIDFYSVQLVPRGNSTHTIFRSFTPGKYPTTYSFYDMIKDLTETESFIGTVFSRSYNAFYFHPSEESDVKFPVNVIKLAKPVNLAYENTTSVLTWTGDDKAYGYDVSIKAIDGDWKTYRVYEPKIDFTEKNDGNKLAPNLYITYVTAVRDDDSRTLPVYLDSVKSDNFTFGLINTPKDFARHVNQFSWTPVGADRYIFFEYKEMTPEEGADSFITYKTKEDGSYETDANGNYIEVFKVADKTIGEVPTHKAVSMTTVDGGGSSIYLGMDAESDYRPTPGVHYYSVQAATSFENSGYDEDALSQLKDGVLYSLLTDPIKVDITYLQKLEPEFIKESDYTTSTVQWQAKDALVIYDTRINNINERDLDNATTYFIDKDESGYYLFKVRAKSSIDEFLYQTSEWSKELTYNVIKLNRPQITISEKDITLRKYRFTWDAIDNALNYSVYINKDGDQWDPIQTNGDLFYDAFAHEGMYSIYVISNNGEINRNPKYIDSEPSNTRKYGVLKAPEEVTLTENIVSWKENPLVDYYEVYNYGKKFAETDRNMFELDVSKPYSYSITIVACSLEEDIFPSAPSRTVQYVVTQLNPPSGVRIEENILSFGLVPNADGYRIYIDDEFVALTTGTKFNVGDFLSVRAGIVKIHVVAYSNKINFIESNPSNFVLKRIEKEKQFNIVINNINYDKVQLPFSMNFTLDEKLDTAGLTLAYIDVKEPFEKLTPADIVIYESEIKSRRFPMVIASDNVEEVKINDSIRYKHHLQLIERTILLQNEIIPDFSISSSIRDFLVRNYEVENATTGSNIAVSNRDEVAFGYYDELDLSFIKDFLEVLQKILDFLGVDGAESMDLSGLDDLKIPTGFVWFKGITPKGEISTVIPKNLRTGEMFILPRPNTRLNCVCFSVRQIINWLINILFGDSGAEAGGSAAGYAYVIKSWRDIVKVVKDILVSNLDDFGDLFKGLGKAAGKAAIIIRVILMLLDYIIYIIKILVDKPGYTWGGLLEKLMTTDLSIVGDCFFTDNDWAFPARNYYIRPHKDFYEKSNDEQLISSFDTTLKNEIGKYTFTKAGTYDLILEIPEVDYQKLYKADLIDFDSNILPGGKNTDLPKANFMVDSNGNSTTYRVVWSGINVTGQTDPSKYLKVSEVLEKVAALASNKYIIDPKVMEYTDTINCPDMTFSNGNYLYDVLETIGREFNGLPRLLEDNVITFDILDVNTDSTKYLSFWKDTDVLGTESQDLENVAAGFISRVSNMVPDEDYTIHPAPGVWTTARSDNKEYAVEYINTAAIAVEKPIYKIGRVLVKNAVIDTTTRKIIEDYELDITPYVYETNVYNALNNNKDGKGKALCWSQGTKFIRGLGQIPEVGKIRAALELSETDYVIQKIVEDYIDKYLSVNDEEKLTYTAAAPTDMLFQVEYQGYTDTTVYIENPDKKTNKYAMYNIFNQEDNTISDTRFGNGATTVLKRHNTTSVQKSYQAYSLLRLPLLGESITINNAPYYIDDLTYEFNNGYTIANCNFSKNYNKINPRTTINSEYRQYELRSDNIVKRITNFNEYCMIGTKDSNLDAISRNSVWKNIVKNSINGNAQVKPECFYINCYNSEDLDKIPFVTGDLSGKITTKYIEGIALPVSYNRLGLSVSLNASMEDNFTAGYSSRREDNNAENLKRVQTYVRYVGDETMDQIPYMRISLGSLSNTVKNHTFTESGVKVSISDTFPGVMWLDQAVSSLNDVCFTKFFKVYKDQREALGFNYQMHFISNREDLFLHRGLTKYLFKSSPLADGKGIKPILVGYNTDITNKDVFTTIYEKLSDISFDGEKILFDNFKSTNNYKGLAVIWPDTKEILLEIRKPITKGQTVSVDPIYFNFSNKIKR